MIFKKSRFSQPTSIFNKKVTHFVTPNPQKIDQNSVQDASGGQLSANFGRKEGKVTEDKQRSTSKEAPEHQKDQKKGQCPVPGLGFDGLAEAAGEVRRGSPSRYGEESGLGLE